MPNWSATSTSIRGIGGQPITDWYGCFADAPLLSVLFCPCERYRAEDPDAASVLKRAHMLYHIYFGNGHKIVRRLETCLLYTSPSPRDRG